MSAPELTYISDDPAKQYASEVGDARSLTDLREILADWQTYAPDAFAVAMGMTEAEWPTFIAGLLQERTKNYAGDDWYGRYAAILLPEDMLHASMLAQQCNAPFGCALIRLREVRAEN